MFLNGILSVETPTLSRDQRRVWKAAHGLVREREYSGAVPFTELERHRELVLRAE